MKTSLLRAVIAIVAGALMMKYRVDMVTWLTISIGALFFLSGVIAVIYYFVARSRARQSALGKMSSPDGAPSAPVREPSLPIVGIGCAILGVILALMPATFVTYIVYVFAAIIILGAIGEYVALATINGIVKEYESQTAAASEVRCGYKYWIIPTLLLLFGIVAILYPQGIASAPFLFMGIAMIVYGLSEIINGIKFFSMRRHISRRRRLLTESAATASAAGAGAVEDAEVTEVDVADGDDVERETHTGVDGDAI